MNILIDGDACPVITEAVKVSSEFGFRPVIFSDTAHNIQRADADSVTVDKGEDSADFAVLSRCNKGDLVITNDYALAALCLAKGAFVLKPDGTEYTDFNIDMMLEGRYIAKKIRSSGGRLPKIKKRTKADDENFILKMREILIRIKK